MGYCREVTPELWPFEASTSGCLLRVRMQVWGLGRVYVCARIMEAAEHPGVREGVRACMLRVRVCAALARRYIRTCACALLHAQRHPRARFFLPNAHTQARRNVPAHACAGAHRCHISTVPPMCPCKRLPVGPIQMQGTNHFCCSLMHRWVDGQSHDRSPSRNGLFVKSLGSFRRVLVVHCRPQGGVHVLHR